LVRTTTEAFFQAIRAAHEGQDDDPARIRQLVDQIVMPHVDLKQVSRGVLGNHWQQATPAQQDGFATSFRKLLVCAYGTALSENRALNITYLPVSMSDDGAEAAVPTRVPRDEAAPLRITYRLHQVDGEWKLYDMLVEDVSLVTNYRSAFSTQINRIGIDGLIQKLKAY
jgi:phospholipid transport system substrate-binding protein